MAEVTVLSADAIHALVDAALNSAVIDGSGHLVFTTVAGDTIDLGDLLSAIPNASTTVQGLVQLATDAETTTGTDAAKATTAHGVAAAIAVLSGSVTTDLAAKAPSASPTLTGTVTVPGVLSVTGVIASPSDALTDAATILVDASLGNYFRVTLGGNRTLGAPSNPTDGQVLTFEIIQDGTGTRTLAYASAYAFGTDVPSPTLTTTASKRDFLTFRYNSTATKWYCLGVLKGY